MKQKAIQRSLALLLALAVAVGTPLPVWAEDGGDPDEKASVSEAAVSGEKDTPAEAEPAAQEAADDEAAQQETPEAKEPEQETSEAEKPEQTETEEAVQEASQAEKAHAVPETSAKRQAARAPEGSDPKATSVSIDLTQIFTTQFTDGSRISYTITVVDANGDPVSESPSANNITFYYDGNKTSGKLNGSGVYTGARSVAAGTHSVYAVYTGTGDYSSSTSETISITVVKPSLKNQLTSTPSLEGQSTGTITASGDYPSLAYYKYPNGTTEQVEGTTIAGLAAGDYYVYTTAYQEGNTFYIESGKEKTTVGETQLTRFNLTLHREGTTYWRSGNTQYAVDKTFEVVEGESQTYRVVANNDYVNGYVLEAVTVTPETNADVTITKDSATSWTVEVTNITGDVTLSATARQLQEYTVTLAGGFDGKVELNNGYALSKIREDQSRDNISIKVIDDDYKLVDVKATNAEVAFDAANSTFSLSNLTGDVVITPVLAEVEVYDVTLDTLDGKISWSGTEPVSIRGNENKTFELTLEDNRYTLDDVTAENATVVYNARTGEVTVSNATGEVKLTPVLTEKEYTISFGYATSQTDKYAAWADTAEITVKATNTEPIIVGASVKPEYASRYYIDEIRVEGTGDAAAVYHGETGKVTISDVTGNVKLLIHVDDVRYTVTLAQNENVKWRKTDFTLISGTSGSVYINPVNSETHVINDVTVSPEGNATVTYSSSTGEVFIQNISGDITLTPVVVEKRIPTTLEVSYHFNENGIYSEENPFIQVTFYVTVKDQFGEIVPRANVYIKNDENEVSPWKRTSDLNGVATFTYSYGISVESGDTAADYNALFALDDGFTNARTTQDIHLVLQQKQNLTLYENQIIGTAPGASNGKVIDVPERYEIWTGEVHQAALVVGSGEWVRAVDGTFTNLSAGQHILRAGEYVDESTNTFYFASDYADFFVPRGVWNVIADLENAQHVIFTGETEQVAEPGGTVYFYVAPEEGYEITGYTVDKPNYLSGGVRYSEENGFVVLEGVTGNVTLTVIAEEKEEEAPPIYTILEGEGGVWIRGSGANLHFKSDGPFEKFTGIRVDGETVNAEHYDASSGSTNVELKAAYLERLTNGNHTLTLEYTDGKVSAGFTVKDGDVPELPPAEEPTAEEPTAEEPTAEEPSAEEPTAEEPSAEEPTAEEPSAEEPSAEEPTAEEPTAEETSHEKSATEKAQAEKSGSHKTRKHTQKTSNPKTADEGQIGRWMLLSALSLGGAAAAVAAAKKRDD